jgi:hypothetical protein
MTQSLSEFDQLVHNCVKRNKLYLIWGAIFFAVLFYYGHDEENAKQQRFFDEARHYDDYQVRVGSHFYHIGIMVSHWANIIVLTMIGILISWMIYMGIKARIWQ